MTKCKSCGQNFQWEDVLDPSGNKIVVGQWSDGSPKYKVKPKNHNCHGNSLNAAIGVTEQPPGLEQAQAHTGIQKYLADIVTPAVQEPLNNIHKMQLDVRDQLSSINNNLMTLLTEFRDLNVNIADFLRGLKIKGKVDHSKDDRVDTFEDKQNEMQKDIHGISDNFNRFAGALEALLIQKGFVTAGELYSKDSKL